MTSWVDDLSLLGVIVLVLCGVPYCGYSAYKEVKQKDHERAICLQEHGGQPWTTEEPFVTTSEGYQT